MSPKSTDALLLAAEGQLSRVLALHDRSRDGRRDEPTERAARAGDCELLLEEQVAQQDDPPECRRENVRDRGDLDRPGPDGTARLEREEDVRPHDVRGENDERADEAE